MSYQEQIGSPSTEPAAILTLAAAVIAVCVRAGEQRHSGRPVGAPDDPAYDADDTAETRSVMAH
jgi:hypothetical protein